MNQRWLLPAVALAGLALLAWWIASNTYWDEVSEPTSLRGNALKNPFYTAQRFAESLGATTEWRQTLGTPPDKHSILVLSYWHWSLIEQRRKQLEQWVQAGGRLILDRTLTGGAEQLKEWSGLALTYKDDDEDAEDDTKAKKTKTPPKHYANQGLCGTLLASYSPKGHDLRDRYTVCRLAPASWIASTRPVFWALHDNEGMQAVRVEIGAGSVTLLNARPFGNRDLTEVDHGLLFVTVTQLQRGDHVVFLSEEKHPTLLALIWANGKPAVLLITLFILAALWRGAARFGPLAAPTETARRSLAEQIRGTGLFTLQFDGSKTLHASMLRAVDEAARRCIVNYAAMNSGDRVAALARATGVDAAKLSEIVQHRGARNKQDLQHAVAFMEAVRRSLLTTRNRQSGNSHFT